MQLGKQADAMPGDRGGLAATSAPLRDLRFVQDRRRTAANQPLRLGL